MNYNRENWNWMQKLFGKYYLGILLLAAIIYFLLYLFGYNLW